MASISETSASISHFIKDRLTRSLIFVHGKGGVGKTAISQAIAHCLSDQQRQTLWICIEDPIRPPGELKQLSPHLWNLNCEFTLAFEEYAGLKIGAPRLTRIFLQNKVIRYLAKAAPGIHELVLLGKIWFESNHYSHVIVDLPATGHGLTLFQSAENFARLFSGGPLNRDAEAMLETFRDPVKTGHLIVALPEEMPLRESLELNDYLKNIFPANPAAFLVNRMFPEVVSEESNLIGTPDSWISPLAHSAMDYAVKRDKLESYNLRIWKDEAIQFGKMDFVPPSTDQGLSKRLAEQLISKGYL